MPSSRDDKASSRPILILNLIFFSFFCAIPAKAKKAPKSKVEEWTWGGEVNFTRQGLGEGNRKPLEEEARAALALVVKYEEFLNRLGLHAEYLGYIDYHGEVHEFTFDTGFSVRFGVDDKVIEVKFPRDTKKNFQRNAELAEKVVFAFMAQEGYEPDPQGSGFHLNLGFEQLFRDHPKLFRNFLVDIANHPELGNGAGGSDLRNAPTFADLSAKQRKAFRQLIEDFDHGVIKTSEELAQGMNEKVYTSATFWNFKTLLNPSRRAANSQHFQGLGMRTVTNPRIPSHLKRIEMRYFRGVKSFKQFLDYIELVERRLIYLDSLSEPLPYLGRNNVDSIQTGVNWYGEYIKPTGLPYDRYRWYLPDPWQVPLPGETLPDFRFRGCLRVLQRLRLRAFPSPQPY